MSFRFGAALCVAATCLLPSLAAEDTATATTTEVSAADKVAEDNSKASYLIGFMMTSEQLMRFKQSNIDGADDFLAGVQDALAELPHALILQMPKPFLPLFDNVSKQRKVAVMPRKIWRKAKPT